MTGLPNSTWHDEMDDSDRPPVGNRPRPLGRVSISRGPTPTARLNALKALPAELASSDALLAALADVSLTVAEAALERLASIAGPDQIVALRGRMLKLDIGLVPSVAAALRRLGDDRATDAALAALASDDSLDRQKAAIALRELRDPTGRRPLVRALRDREAAVRRTALEALACLPATNATLDACYHRLYDEDTSVRIAAAKAVAVLDPKASDALEPLLSDPQPRVRTAVAGAADALSDDELRMLLADRDADVREQTLTALTARPRAALVDDIVAVLDDDSWHVRRAACAALGASRAPEAASPLVACLTDPHASVRRRASLALEQLLEEDLDQRLEQALATDDPRLRRALVEILGERGRFDSLLRFVDDLDPTVRITLVHALRRASSDEVQAALRTLAADRDLAVRHAVEMTDKGTTQPSGETSTKNSSNWPVR